MLEQVSYYRLFCLLLCPSLSSPGRYPPRRYYFTYNVSQIITPNPSSYRSNWTIIFSPSLLPPHFQQSAHHRLITHQTLATVMGIKSFAEGGIAAVVAGSTTHPLDLIKVRMQLQGESASSLPRRLGPIAVGVKIFRTEGPSALFSGVSATILRQALYSTTRIGLYDLLKTNWSAAGEGKPPNLPLHKKIAAGLIAGAVGAAVGNPADVAMVRMQADGRLPAAERRNYTGVGNAIAQMARREGVVSLWRGSGPTVMRAMIVTASQLATYDQAKEAVVGSGLMGDGMPTHVAASMAAGLVASAASNPVDVVKTRVMNMKVEKGVSPPYAGAVDCVVKTVRTEGVTALYKGFVPTVTRQGPFTVVLFVALEQVRSLLKDF